MSSIKQSVRRFMDFGPFKSAAEQLISQRNSAVERLESLKRRREDLHTLPPHPDDLKALFSAWFDGQAEGYCRNLHQSVQALSFVAIKEGFRPYSKWLGMDHRANALHEEYVTPDAIAFFFRDTMKSAVVKEIERMDFDGHGPRHAERLKELSVIESEIEEIESELEMLQQAGREAGIYFR